MISDKEKRNRTGILWITAILFLYMFYYLSYSNALINTNVLLIAACLVLFVEVFMRLFRNDNKLSFLIFVAFVGSLWAFISSLINGSGLGSAITQTFLLISVCLLSETTVSTVQYKKIMALMSVIIIIVLVVFSKPSLYRSNFMSRLPYMGSEIAINPNCIAMLTFFLFVYLCRLIEEMKWKKTSKRFFQFSVMVVSVGYICFASSRTAVVSCIIFMLLLLFCKYKNHKLTRYMFLVGLSVSLIIVFVYIALYLSDFTPSGTLFGKSFYTGREIIWTEALDKLKDHWLFGFSNRTPFGPKAILSTHNSLLAICCYFGVFGLLTTVVVLYKAMKKINYKNNIVAVSALFAALFFVSFETMITDWSLLVPFCFLFLQKKKEEQR